MTLASKPCDQATGIASIHAPMIGNALHYGKHLRDLLHADLLGIA